VKESLHDDLITSFNEGDAASFKHLFDLYYPQLFAFARNFVGYEDAQDIVANTFMKLWQQKENINSISNIKAFLHTTIKNSCLNYLRHEKLKVDKQKEIVYLSERDLEIDFSVSEIEANIYQRIFEEVENLPEKCKEVFKLAFFKRLKNAEIAEILKINEQTVKNQKVKALKSLRLAFNKNRPLIIFFTLLDMEKWFK
jgi:RNA polymerase sigma-70 factor (family 1)